MPVKKSCHEDKKEPPQFEIEYITPHWEAHDVRFSVSCKRINRTDRLEEVGAAAKAFLLDGVREITQGNIKIKPSFVHRLEEDRDTVIIDLRYHRTPQAESYLLSIANLFQDTYPAPQNQEIRDCEKKGTCNKKAGIETAISV